MDVEKILATLETIIENQVLIAKRLDRMSDAQNKFFIEARKALFNLENPEYATRDWRV